MLVEMPKIESEIVPNIKECTLYLIMDGSETQTAIFAGDQVIYFERYHGGMISHSTRQWFLDNCRIVREYRPGEKLTVEV